MDRAASTTSHVFARTLPLLLAVGLAVGGLGGARASGDPCAGALCAGAAKEDMTPPIGVPMGGFFARSCTSGAARCSAQLQQRGPDGNLYAKSFRQSEGIHTVQHARALVLQDAGGRRYAFASLENRGVPYELHQAVAARLRGAGIPGERLMFSSTHSHSSPSPLNPWTAYGAISTDLYDPRVFDIVAGALTRAIVRAASRLEPARVGVGTAELLGASRNRSFAAHLRNPDVDHTGQTDTSSNAIDPTVTLVRADALDGRPIGVFFAFAIHGTSLGDANNLMSGDNMGATMRLCEQALGALAGSGPAPVCAQANGTEGDVSPRADTTDVHVPSDLAKATQTGAQVADGVARAWANASLSDVVELDARFSVLWFHGQEGDPGKPSSPVPMVGVGGNVGPDGMGLPLDLPGSGSKLPIGAAAGGYPQYAPIQIVRVGTTALIALPFEMTVQMGVRVRAAALAAAPSVLSDAAIVGLGNGYVSYIATPEEYGANMYEGAWTLYGPEEGNVVRNEVARLARDMAEGRVTESVPAPPLGERIATNPGDGLLPEAGTIGAVTAPPPATVARGEVVSISWVGGDPAADRPRGAVMVALRRAGPGGWQTVGTEDDLWSILRVDPARGAGGTTWTWTARFDLPLDLPAGSYRVEVAGTSVAQGDYSVVTPSFEVTPSLALGISVARSSQSATLTLEGAWPAPAGERYAPRPKRAAQGGSVRYAVLRGGVLVESGVAPLGVPFASEARAGDVLRVEEREVHGEAGDSNGSALEVPIA